MAWPTEVYVATTLNGVYHTTTFTPPDVATQPTWAAVNDGLANTLVKQFALDPFNQAGRQYCLLENGTLYRRTGGDWGSVLTAAEAQAECGVASGQPTAFCCDTNADGTLYVLHTGDLIDIDPYVLKSTDYGATWTGGMCYESNLGKTRHVGGIRAHDPYVWIGWCGRATPYGLLIYSVSGGSAAWGVEPLSSGSWAPFVCGMPVGSPDTIYYQGLSSAAQRLSRYTAGGAPTDLQSDPTPHRLDCMWFSPTNPLHSRLHTNDRLYETTDGWATVATVSEQLLSPLGSTPSGSLAGADRNNYDALLIGIGSVDSVLHTVYAYDAATGTITGKGGAMISDAPYTDSIPYSSGVAWDGVQPVFGAPGRWRVYSCRYEEAS